MDHISSKNIFLLVRDVLKLLDGRPMEQGARTSYIVYKMLQSTELFEEFEMAELCCVAMLRDIGAYKTNDIDKMMKPGFRDMMPHAIYGYLFMKHLFPVPAYGKILLYHHMDYEQMEGVSYEFDFMSQYIHLADEINTRMQANPEKFDCRALEFYIGTRYSEKIYRIFQQAEEQYQILDHLKGGSWRDEIRNLMDFVLLRNEEKKKYMEMLIYCVGFYSESSVVDTISCICISGEIGKRLGLTQESLEILYYGTMLHDIGMLSIPREIVEAPRPLTIEERDIVKKHVETEENILRKRFNNQLIVDVAVRHHERLDGSGYPRGLKAAEMRIEDEILQVADIVCALISPRVYHKRKNKEEVNRILLEEIKRGHLSGPAARTLLENYDRIMKRVAEESEQILATYRRLEKQYEKVLVQYKNLLR